MFTSEYPLKDKQQKSVIAMPEQILTDFFIVILDCDWMGGYPLSHASTVQPIDAWKHAVPPKPGPASAKGPLRPALRGTPNLGVSSLCRLHKLR